MKSVRVQRPNGSILFETGPHSIRTTPVPGLAPLEVVDQLKILNDAVFLRNDSVAAQGRYLKYNGRLRTLAAPSGVREWISMLSDGFMRAQIWGLLRLAILRPWGPPGREDESIGDFMRRTTNPVCADVLPSAAAHGIYAGDFDRLSMRSTVFKGLWNMYVKRKFTFKPPLENEELGERMQSDFSHNLHKAATGSLSFTFPDGTETYANNDG
jgi:protoporphyrinogen/coproporphyrinogen III oxidase